jgi:queuine tRNA-ribosyltransferase
MSFTLLGRDPCSRARTGMLALRHGTVFTPCFMPVGTNATVKAMRNRDLEEIGVNMILGNTYHLYLRPGQEVIGKAGGLHGFMGWRHNILTDSGGYQVFSLSSFRKVEDEGVSFRSHIDGSAHTLTPEGVVDIQTTLGSDVMMPLDECTAPGIPLGDAKEATRRTTAWLRRSKERWGERTASQRHEGLGPAGPGQLFGIMQGNFHKELRKESAGEIVELDLPGYAIGGLSVGEEFPVFQDLLHYSAELLPEVKPKYLMGIGTPQYILEAVEAGIDLFDCVFPTRTARNALVFTPDGPLSLRNEKYRLDFGPVDAECTCETCRNHSRAYLRHLFKAREIEAAVLATGHNLAFIQNLVKGIRASIARGKFMEFKQGFLARYAKGPAADVPNI